MKQTAETIQNKRRNDNGDTLRNEFNMVIIVYLLWFGGMCVHYWPTENENLFM